MKVSLLPIVAILALAGCHWPGAVPEHADERAADASCAVVRASYDVGSSSTKVKVARVDPCRGEILDVLLDETLRVDYQHDLAGSSDGTLSDAVRAEGLDAIRQLKAAAAAHEPERHVGVATSAFREAANAPAFIRAIRDEAGVEVRIIPQAEEATLGFRAAVAVAGVSAQQAIVWDIGGGSMQIVARDDEGGFLVYAGDHASVTFRNRLIEEIKGGDPRVAESPNPVHRPHAEAALALAGRLAREIPEPLAARLRQDEAVVLGIGGVHVYSIAGQVGTPDRPYTREQVARVLAERLGSTDEQIGGPHASTEVSNLLLVLGYMETLGIEAVQPVQTGMIDAMLVQ